MDGDASNGVMLRPQPKHLSHGDRSERFLGCDLGMTPTIARAVNSPGGYLRWSLVVGRWSVGGYLRWSLVVGRWSLVRRRLAPLVVGRGSGRHHRKFNGGDDGEAQTGVCFP